MSIKDFGRHKYQITMGDGFIQDCFAVQNDSESRTYEFQIFDIDNKVKNASNISIKLAVDTGKGKVVLADGELITPEKGIFAVTLNASQLQEYGDLDAQIMLTEGTKTLRSKIFKINVCASIFEGGTYGKNLILDFNEFAKMAKKVDEWIANPETLKGPKGDRGERGPQGEKGATGERGPQGEKGEKGQDGAVTFESLTPAQKLEIKGDRGERGPQGEKGATGERGPQGEKGEKGQDGAVTFESLTPAQKLEIKGDRGERGPQGLKGPKGDKGDPGQNATVVNDLTSGGIDKALSAEMGKNLNELIISGLDNLASKLR